MKPKYKCITFRFKGVNIIHDVKIKEDPDFFYSFKQNNYTFDVNVDQDNNKIIVYEFDKKFDTPCHRYLTVATFKIKEFFKGFEITVNHNDELIKGKLSGDKLNDKWEVLIPSFIHGVNEIIYRTETELLEYYELL